MAIGSGARERSLWLTALAASSAVVVMLLVDGGGGGHSAVAATASGDVVTLSGVGTVQGVPDTLTATFDVHVTRATVQTALDAESGAVHRVLGALGRRGVSGRNVQTASLQLSPHWNTHGVVTGYDATETVTARVSPLRRAGAAISAAAASSGNDVNVDGFTFDIADDRTLLTGARKSAFADARSRAQQYADLTGRGLGSVMKVSETVEAEQPMPQRYDAGALAGGPGPKAVAIRPGEQPVTVSVVVVWRLS